MRLTLLSIILVLAACTTTQPVDFLPGGRVLRGRVTDADGLPLANALVEAPRDARGGCIRLVPFPSANTDADGRFAIELSGLFDGVPLIVTARGHWVAWDPAIDGDVELTLADGPDAGTATSELTVQVVGCENASVYAHREFAERLSGGWYSIQVPDDAPFALSTSCSDAPGLRERVQLRDAHDSEVVRVRFEPRVPITIEVRDETGRPVSRLILLLLAQSADGSSRQNTVLETDERGLATVMLGADMRDLRFRSTFGQWLEAKRTWRGEPVLRFVHPVIPARELRR